MDIVYTDMNAGVSLFACVRFSIFCYHGEKYKPCKYNNPANGRLHYSHERQHQEGRPYWYDQGFFIIVHYTFSGIRSPSRPVGLKIRIRISTIKANASLYSLDIYAAPRLSSMPRRNPPNTAPWMLPIPPSTAAVNALIPATYPM